MEKIVKSINGAYNVMYNGSSDMIYPFCSLIDIEWYYEIWWMLMTLLDKWLIR